MRAHRATTDNHHVSCHAVISLSHTFSEQGGEPSRRGGQHHQVHEITLSKHGAQGRKNWLLTRIGGFGSNQLMWLRIKTDIDPSGRMCRLPPARYIKEDDVMPLALSQSNPAVGSSLSFCSGRKLGDLEQALLWSLLQEDPQCPSRLLLDEAARRQRPIAVSL